MKRDTNQYWVAVLHKVIANNKSAITQAKELEIRTGFPATQVDTIQRAQDKIAECESVLGFIGAAP